MRILRELSRRRLRTKLKVLGIVIRIWALVVFSSMANKINTLVASGSDYYVGKVVVMAFETWRSLTEHGITDDPARDMMVGFVAGIAGAAGGAPAR